MLMGSSCGNRRTSKIRSGVGAFSRTLDPQPGASALTCAHIAWLDQVLTPHFVACTHVSLIDDCLSVMATSRSGLDGDIDSSLDDEADEQPIRLMAEDCDEMFHDCLARSVVSKEHPLPLDVLYMMGEYQQRFNGWCTFLGVFANEITNLDYRLRNHEALQDMVIRMLDMLRQNLFLGKRPSTLSRERS